MACQGGIGPWQTPGIGVFELQFRTRLSASVDEVWTIVSTMAGVNAELGPWVRMTHPSELVSLEQIGEIEFVAGQVVFRSWVLALGILPFDRHALALERVLPGEGFDEESTSWMQRRWRHERRVLVDGDGCVVTDRLVVEPRLGFATPVVRPIVRWLFRHRHRRLVARFGAG